MGNCTHAIGPIILRWSAFFGLDKLYYYCICCLHSCKDSAQRRKGGKEILNPVKYGGNENITKVSKWNKTNWIKERMNTMRHY
jgi:hypothetical protein